MAGPRPLRGFAEAVGGATLGVVYLLGGIALLVRDAIGHAIMGPFRGRPVRGKALWTQSVRTGVRSLGIVCLVAFFIGVILALIGGDLLLWLGIPTYVSPLLAIGIVQELGPLLTGVVMTGFIGAALAAEIATMVVSEEITALTTMSLNPVRYIVAPRLFAVILMVPCVTLIGNWVGLLGGALVSITLIDLSWKEYWDGVWEALAAKHIFRGSLKSLVFGVLIGSIGCYQGFQVKGGAEGVGRVTTRAVVQTLVAIIIADAVLNYFLLFRT